MPGGLVIGMPHLESAIKKPPRGTAPGASWPRAFRRAGLLRVLVPRNADGGRCHGRMLGDSLEAESVAGRSCPRERWDDGYAVVCPVLAQRRAAVSVPLLHRVWHVHIQAEIWREHAVIAAQNVQVVLWTLPHALELVVVDKEVAPLAVLLVARRALRVIEALKLIRLRARLRDAREPVPAAVSPRADAEVVRVVGTQPLRAVRQNLGLELRPEAAHDSLVLRERELLIFPTWYFRVKRCGPSSIVVVSKSPSLQ